MIRMFRTALTASAEHAWFTLFVCAMLAASPAEAQVVKWWQEAEVRRDLALSPQQSEDVDQIFERALPTLRRNRQALDDAQATLGHLLAYGTEAEVAAQVDVLVEAIATCNKARVLTLFDMYRVLTPVQRRKLAALSKLRAPRPPASLSLR
jgi:Spy/CpxP family protein refolding chaperone